MGINAQVPKQKNKMWVAGISEAIKRFCSRKEWFNSLACGSLCRYSIIFLCHLGSRILDVQEFNPQISPCESVPLPETYTGG